MIDYMGIISHTQDYYKMFTKNKVTQGMPKSFNKSYFDLMDEFMHSKSCFNLSHSQDFMNPKDDIYCAQPYLQESSPYDDFDINE